MQDIYCIFFIYLTKMLRVLYIEITNLRLCKG